ncbi:MAG: hypothetical protein ABSC25_08700 [Roseiarcus sp.]|jgi:hypothetical protein
MPARIEHDKCIAAFAIEDRVDFAFFDGEVCGFTELIEGDSYFENVRRRMEGLLRKLVVEKGYIGKVRELFGRIESIIISTAGVVEGNASVVQCPLWAWETQDIITWNWRGRKKVGFNFRLELRDIASELAHEDDNLGPLDEVSGARLLSRVFVVNDATASAIFEYAKRVSMFGTISNDFVYIKAHEGVNVGVVELDSRGRHFNIRTTHPELGHFYPRLHKLDLSSGYDGACPFHGNCLEGMVAPASFVERSMLEGQNPMFDGWARFRKRIRFRASASTISGSDREATERRNAVLTNQIVGGGRDPSTKKEYPGTNDGIEFVAFYLSQLVHQLAIGPLAPSQIVLGGRLAREKVVAAVRRRVVDMVKEYPLRRDLVFEIERFIVRTAATTKEKAQIEVAGGLLLALSRASAETQNLDLSRIPAIPIPESLQPLPLPQIVRP